MDYSEILSFHGHACPGLAIGYRMAQAAMNALQIERSGDEEIVAVVENDACGVDALQCLTGCTFGKGNLIFRDYGKQVYTLFSRSTGRGVRVAFHDDKVPHELSADREARAAYILDGSHTDFLTLTDVTIPEPPKARKRPSVLCAICNEPVMETRVREIDGEFRCIPCSTSG